MFNTIASVDPDCPLAGKVLPGDELLYVNRHEIRDVLDYKYWTYDKKLLLEFKNAGKIRVRKDAGQDGPAHGLRQPVRVLLRGPAAPGHALHPVFQG